MAGEPGAHRQVVRVVEPARQRPAVAGEAHRGRPAALDHGPLGHQLVEALLDAGLDGRGWPGVVAHFAVEVEVAPAADREPPVWGLPPIAIAVARRDRAG